MSGAWHPGPRDGSRKGKEERRSRNRPDRAGIYEYQRTDRRVRTDETCETELWAECLNRNRKDVAAGNDAEMRLW